MVNIPRIATTTAFTLWLATASMADCNRNRTIQIINNDWTVSCGTVNSCTISTDCRQQVLDMLWVENYFDLDWDNQWEYNSQVELCALDKFDSVITEQWLSQPKNPIIHDELMWERNILDAQDPTTTWTIAPEGTDIDNFNGKALNSCRSALLS